MIESLQISNWLYKFVNKKKKIKAHILNFYNISFVSLYSFNVANKLTHIFEDMYLYNLW